MFIYNLGVKIKVAIVEDEINSLNDLKKLILGYKDKYSFEYEIYSYFNGLDFLNDYKGQFDVIFLDIEMPKINGMEVAKKIRSLNDSTLIIFETNIIQYAIDGYEVQAFDFLVKPIKEPRFRLTFSRISNELNHKYNEETITINTKSEILNILIDDLLYIEVMNHNLFVHTIKETIKIRGQLNAFETKLKNNSFSRCNNPYLVNLKHVKSIKGEYCILDNDEELKISQTKRNSFLSDFANYIGV